ncbi:CHAT domain-containing protein [Roridomyces roridus]|uniref:CHAT domain-containing protein n=1 Tax=Roridomyces roridus TaxID=1738132 RepID=A0AAD7FE65_9AGAR|nr:CHAT domain-containing protein [Roridomyces roridus]
MKAYQVALDLLPELAWLGLPIPDRHHHLREVSLVVRDAAACALEAKEPEKAVEWLEQGRAVIWGQMLNLRTPMDALMEQDPKRAHELLSLSSQLERLGMQSNTELQNSVHQSTPQSIAAQAHHVTKKRQKLIQEGLDDQVLHIPLEDPSQDLDSAVGRRLPKSLRELAGRSIRLEGVREGDSTTENQFESILSALWLGIVKPVLDGLAFSTPQTANKPRIWWCLTGPLVFFPIHAAGIYGGESKIRSKVSDYVISSYTPSVTALVEGYRRQSVSYKGLHMLAVAQPAASGQRHIPGTKTEINHIKDLARAKGIHVITLHEDQATVAKVQKEMQKCQWAHFACHGVQDVATPTASGLLLAGDSCLTLANIIQLPLPEADFAFLSACHTATGDEKFQEESVHLAAGMLLAGYRGLIATMWTIEDQDAPQVAKDVYEHLLQTSPPDPIKAAEALHLAVEKLLEKSPKKSFLDWVPYIHMGI